MDKVLVLHGPNLNLLGQREPNIYGSLTLTEIDTCLTDLAQKLSMHVECRQSNHEGLLIDWIQKADEIFNGIILNAGAYTHTSFAIADAIRAIEIPVIEVHLSNIFARESFRHQSCIAPVVRGQITGLGVESYLLALIALSRL